MAKKAKKQTKIKTQCKKARSVIFFSHHIENDDDSITHALPKEEVTFYFSLPFSFCNLKKKGGKKKKVDLLYFSNHECIMMKNDDDIITLAEKKVTFSFSLSFFFSFFFFFLCFSLYDLKRKEKKKRKSRSIIFSPITSAP